jgi:hypothetical protein
MQIASSEEITRLERNVPVAGDYGRRHAVSSDCSEPSGESSTRSTAWAPPARRLCAPSLPGISEALVTTAAGLAAAIPAVIAYNLIIGSIREMASRNDDFALEMLNLVERQQRATQVTEVRR